MKLETSILPRRDGTVTVRNDQGAPFVFKPDDAGTLTCDVTDASLVARLLALGDFYPVDAADYHAALVMTKAVPQAPDPDDDDDAPDDDGEDDLDGDEPVMDALPIEAETPPVQPVSRRSSRRG